MAVQDTGDRLVRHPGERRHLPDVGSSRVRRHQRDTTHHVDNVPPYPSIGRPVTRIDAAASFESPQDRAADHVRVGDCDGSSCASTHSMCDCVSTINSVMRSKARTGSPSMTARATASCSAIADCGPPGACTVTRRLARSAAPIAPVSRTSVAFFVADRIAAWKSRSVTTYRSSSSADPDEIVGEDPQPLGLLVAPAHRRESRRRGLDDQPHFGHVADDVGDRSVVEHPSEHLGVEHVPGHPRERDGADLGPRPQESLRCQHLRRFADHGAGDAEPLAEFGLDRQRNALGEFARHDGDPEVGHRLVVQQRASARRRLRTGGSTDRSGWTWSFGERRAASAAPSRRGGGAARARAGTDGRPAHPSRGRSPSPGRRLTSTYPSDDDQGHRP